MWPRAEAGMRLTAGLPLKWRARAAALGQGCRRALPTGRPSAGQRSRRGKPGAHCSSRPCSPTGGAALEACMPALPVSRPSATGQCSRRGPGRGALQQQVLQPSRRKHWHRNGRNWNICTRSSTPERTLRRGCAACHLHAEVHAARCTLHTAPKRFCSCTAWMPHRMLRDLQCTPGCMRHGVCRGHTLTRPAGQGGAGRCWGGGTYHPESNHEEALEDHVVYEEV